MGTDGLWSCCGGEQLVQLRVQGLRFAHRRQRPSFSDPGNTYLRESAEPGDGSSIRERAFASKVELLQELTDTGKDTNRAEAPRVPGLNPSAPNLSASNTTILGQVAP